MNPAAIAETGAWPEDRAGQQAALRWAQDRLADHHRPDYPTACRVLAAACRWDYETRRPQCNRRCCT